LTLQLAPLIPLIAKFISKDFGLHKLWAVVVKGPDNVNQTCYWMLRRQCRLTEKGCAWRNESMR